MKRISNEWNNIIKFIIPYCLPGQYAVYYEWLNAMRYMFPLKYVRGLCMNKLNKLKWIKKLTQLKLNNMIFIS